MAELGSSSRQVTIQCEHAGPIVYNNFPKNATWLGLIQILGGVAMIVTGVITMTSGPASLVYGFYGFNLVIPLIVTGAFGVAAGRSKALCQITTAMIFSILTALSSIGTSIALGMAIYVLVQMDLSSVRAEGLSALFEGRSMNEHNFRDYSKERDLCFAMLGIAVIEAIMSLWLSVIACHFSCFCCKNCCYKYDTTTTEQFIISNPSQEQQFLLIASSAAGHAGMQPMSYGDDSQLKQHPQHFSKFDV